MTQKTNELLNPLDAIAHQPSVEVGLRRAHAHDRHLAARVAADGHQHRELHVLLSQHSEQTQTLAQERPFIAHIGRQ